MPISHQHVAHHHFSRLLVLGVGTIVAAILATTLALNGGQPVLEQSVPCSPLALTESVARADLILTGNVFLVVPEGATYANVLITPQKVYKGALPKEGVRIRALAATAGMNIPSDDLHFASNQPPYLLFLQEGADGVYNTSKCVGSRFLGSGLTAAEQLVLETTSTVQ